MTVTSLGFFNIEDYYRSCNFGCLWTIQFKFLCKVIFYCFCSNWFKLVSAQPLNSKTFNQKKVLLLTSSRMLDQIFFLPEIWGCLHRFEEKNYLKILMMVTCLGFFNIEDFYGRCNFGCLWLIFLYSGPIRGTHQNLCMTFKNILGFLLKCLIW